METETTGKKLPYENLIVVLNGESHMNEICLRRNGHYLSFLSTGQFCDSDLEVLQIAKPALFVSKSLVVHRRLNHKLRTINEHARKRSSLEGLPRLKFEKDHLCSACQLGKSKKFSHRPKSKNTNMEVLHTLHMDLCGPMRVQSIKGKKYILVIVDDYSRFTWVKFLRSKDETPEFVINFLKQIQLGLNKTVRFIRTDNGTEFVNQVMSEYYEGVGIFHQKSVPRTPQQNGVVERRNRTLVEAARTMMIFSKAPMFLWAEAVATLLNPETEYLNSDSSQKNKPLIASKADIGIFVGYAPSRKGYRIYNKRTRRLMETIHVTFDEMHQSMAPDLLLTENNAQHCSTQRGYIVSTTLLMMQPSISASSTTSDIHPPVQHQEVAEEPTYARQNGKVREYAPINHDVLHPSHNLDTGDPGSAQSSSGNVNSVEPNQVNYTTRSSQKMDQRSSSG
ncbi:retrovirus-related pol polyprotein from transposon TNT 1-94 [Tanacetum coccineum]